MDDTDLRIHLLGVFHVGVGSRHVDDTAWRLKRPAALVKLLALAEGHRLHREQVMDRLWPDLDPKAAAANLRKAVHLARRALDQDEGARWLRSEGDLLALPRDAWVDVDAFESAASDARRSGDLKVYRAALELYTGDLLPEDRYEEWVGPRQDELRTEFIALSMELAGLLEARADLEGAVEALRRVVDLDPLNEEAHVRLIRAYALAGRRRQALDQFDRLRTLFDRELRVEPSVAAQRLHEEIRAGTGLEPRVTTELWERVGDLRLVSGDGDGAARAFEEAMREHPDRDDPSVAVRLHRKIATAFLVEHRADAVERHLGAAEATLAGDEAERGRLLALRAKLLCELGSPAEALDAAEESLLLAERHGDESDIAAANESLAIVHHVRGEWRAGLHAEILRVGSRAEGDARLARVLDLHHCIGQYHLYGDDLFQGVEEFARSTLDLAQTRGARRAEAFAWCLLGESLLLRGHFDEAAGCLERSGEIHAEFGTRSGALPWQRLAELEVCRGNPDAADVHIRRGMTIATVSPMASHLWGRLYATAALAALERGDNRAAVRAVRSADAAAARYGDCPTCSALLHPVAAEAWAASGDAGRAFAHAEAAAKVGASFQSSAWLAMSEAAHGWAARAAGDAEIATERFSSAAALFDRGGQPYWAGRVRDLARSSAPS